jgi:hypothetical protein
MATMGGGSAAVPVLDPDDEPRVKNDELIWHLIEPQLYVDNPNFPGQKILKSGTFSHGHSGVSFVRCVIAAITIQYVQTHFPGYGIAEFTVAEVRAIGCIFQIEPDPQWPPDAHICAYKPPGKGRIQGGKINKFKALAFAKPWILTPTP